MEQYLTRTEILRLVRAHLGIQTDESLSSQVGDRHVAIVQAAALQVMQDCRWANALRKVTVDLGAQQNAVNYPAGQGPGSIIGMAVYVDEKYYPLEKRSLPAWSDQDQQIAAGGDTLDAVAGPPRFFEERNQIALYPVSDKAYKLRIEYTARGDLPTEGSLSLVDGLLIVYRAGYTIAQGDGDSLAATTMAESYKGRLSALRGWQAAGSRFPMDSTADFAEGEFPITSRPNWYRGPTDPNPATRGNVTP